MNSVSKSMLREISRISCFNYNNCPICGKKLIVHSINHDDVSIKCMNKCYSCFKLTIDIKDNLIFLPHTVLIFDKEFGFSKSVQNIVDDRHYYYDYALFAMLKKRAENLIEYYKFNERYLINVLSEDNSR